MVTTEIHANGLQPAPSLYATAAHAITTAHPTARLRRPTAAARRAWSRARRYCGSVTALALFAAAAFVAAPLWVGLAVTGVCVGVLELHVHVVNQQGPPESGR